MKIKILKRIIISTWKKEDEKEKSETQEVEIASFELGIKETNSFLSMFNRDGSMALGEDGNIELEGFFDFNSCVDEKKTATSTDSSIVIKITK
jgi:hypothetical protein